MLVAQLCPTLCNPMDCSPPGFSVYEIFQARILEWVAISFSRGFSQPRDQTQVSWTAGRFFTNWATRETQRINGMVFNREDCNYIQDAAIWDDIKINHNFSDLGRVQMIFKSYLVFILLCIFWIAFYNNYGLPIKKLNNEWNILYL